MILLVTKTIQNIKVTSVALLLMVFTLSVSAPAQGLRFMSEEDYIAMEKASIALLKDVPASHDLSKWFPTPGNQGEQASCVGWALAYGIKTYQEAVELQRPPTSDDHIFSPAFIYNQINDWGCFGGSSIEDALNLMQNRGVATLSDFPYDEDDCEKEPTSDIKQSASNYTISGWKRVEFFNEGMMKTLLVSGQPIVIGMQTDAWFHKLEAGEVYRVASNRRGGGHALVVVGYDDRRGAYKVYNSWGTDWGDGGFGWMAYEIFVDVVREAYILEDEQTNIQKRQSKGGKSREVPPPPPVETGANSDAVLPKTR